MKPNASSDLPRAALQLLAIGALIGGSFLILRPFLGSLIWAIAIVVATWPVLLQLEALLGGRRSLAVSLMTAVLVLLVALPIYFGIGAIVANAQRIAGWTEALATAKLPEPPAWLASIPLLGEKLAALWRQVADASSDELVAHLAPYGQDLVKWFVSQIGSAGTLFVQLLLTVVLCGILYANGDAASVAARQLAARLGGAEGADAVRLAAQAIRSVALGVVVTAVLQSAFVGLGLAVAGVPFAALLTAVTFLLAVAQIGALPTLVPAVFWVYSKSGFGPGTAFLLWAIFCSTFDNFLRPMLIRRGADLPLVLIFSGVVGGLIAFGIIGLFIGPVVLAVTYTLLVDWIEQEPT